MASIVVELTNEFLLYAPTHDKLFEVEHLGEIPYQEPVFKSVSQHLAFDKAFLVDDFFEHLKVKTQELPAVIDDPEAFGYGG